MKKKPRYIQVTKQRQARSPQDQDRYIYVRTPPNQSQRKPPKDLDRYRHKQSNHKSRYHEVVSARNEKNQHGFVEFKSGAEILSMPLETKDLKDWLIQNFKKGSIECPICFNQIKHFEKIWSCQQCCQPFHLKCIHKWIKAKDNRQLQFRCPKCQKDYKLYSLPNYYCFCGKYKQPESNTYLIPHSCGQICSKSRGPRCRHPCNQSCHPGLCNPCLSPGQPITCHCGKSSKQTICSQFILTFQCEKMCGQKLGCGSHYCQKRCHAGPCPPCHIIQQVSCHCLSTSSGMSCGTIGFSCKKRCAKQYQCGQHRCEKICHSDKCGPCPRNPAQMKTCPCGRYLIQILLDKPRLTCKQDVPLCGQTCRKKLKCGHSCKQNCHEGPCPNCQELVDQTCRCGNSIQKASCSRVQQEPFFICETVCKQRRDCKRHQCRELCCVGLNHKCTIPCKKLLSCRKHQCQLPCHIPPCKDCPNIGVNPLPCFCGKKVKRPPIFCGTQPEMCGNPCQKRMGCGHLCYKSCHPGACKCDQPAQISCLCGREKIKSTCGVEGLCFNYCDLHLNCGHNCGKQCHKPGQCSKQCQRKCLKKKNCTHLCKARCHFGTQCLLTCQQIVSCSCQCGNIQSNRRCGNEIKIQCNSGCQNNRRFKVLFDAKEVYYPYFLIKFAKQNQTFLTKLQRELEAFVRSGDRYLHSSTRPEFKSHLVTLLTRHYFLKLSFNLGPKCVYSAQISNKALIPSPTLSQFAAGMASDDPRLQQWSKEPPKPFNASIRLTRFNFTQAENALKKFGNQFYLQQNKGQWWAHFWDYRLAQSCRVQLKDITETIIIYQNKLMQKLLQQQNEQIKIIAQSSEKEVTFSEGQLFKKTGIQGVCSLFCSPSQQEREAQPLEQSEKITKHFRNEAIEIRKAQVLESVYSHLLDLLQNKKLPFKQTLAFFVSRTWVLLQQAQAQALQYIGIAQGFVLSCLLALVHGLQVPEVRNGISYCKGLYKKHKNKAKKALKIRSASNINLILNLLDEVGIQLSGKEPFVQAFSMALDLRQGKQSLAAQELMNQPVLQSLSTVKELVQKKKWKQLSNVLLGMDFVHGCIVSVIFNNPPKQLQQLFVRDESGLYIFLSQKKKSFHFDEQEGQSVWREFVTAEFVSDVGEQRYLGKLVKVLRQ